MNKKERGEQEEIIEDRKWGEKKESKGKGEGRRTFDKVIFSGTVSPMSEIKRIE